MTCTVYIFCASGGIIEGIVVGLAFAVLPVTFVTHKVVFLFLDIYSFGQALLHISVELWTIL